jgi:adenylate cyclase
MNEFFFTELSAWLTQVGLDGTSEPEIVFGFCERCVAAGMPLARGLVFIDTLDPVHEGRVFRWGYNPGLAPMAEYGRTSQEGLAAGGFDPQDVEPPDAGATALSITCCRPALRCCDDD